MIDALKEVWDWLLGLLTPLFGDLAAMVAGAIPALVIFGLMWALLDDQKGSGKKKGGRDQGRRRDSGKSSGGGWWSGERESGGREKDDRK